MNINDEQNHMAQTDISLELLHSLLHLRSNCEIVNVFMKPGAGSAFTILIKSPDIPSMKELGLRPGDDVPKARIMYEKIFTHLELVENHDRKNNKNSK